MLRIETIAKNFKILWSLQVRTCVYAYRTLRAWFRILQLVGARRSDHMTPILRDLHWLPIPARLEFKILLLTFKCLHNQGPSYLRELLKFRNPSRTLRSSKQSLLQNSYRPNTLFYGERAFAFAAPKLWNSIPEHIKSASSLLTFKTALKTYLFRRHLLDDQ